MFEQVVSTGSHTKDMGSTNCKKRGIERTTRPPLAAVGIVWFLQFVPEAHGPWAGANPPRNVRTQPDSRLSRVSGAQRTKHDSFL